MTPRKILIACWLVFVVYAWPGYMTSASIDMLADARAGSFTDWNVPLLSELWRIVGVVISGPAGMLVVQSLLFVLGAYAIARQLVPDRTAAIIAGVTLIFPPVMACLAVVGPEALLAGLLTAAFGALGSDRPWLRRAGLVLAALACGMSHGGALAALPVVVLGWPYHAASPRWRRAAIAVVAWLGLVAAAMLATYAVVDAHTKRSEIERAGIDVIGMIANAGTLSDAAIAAQLHGVELAPAEHRQVAIRKAYGHPERYFGPILTWPDSEAATTALIDARSRLIRAYPGAFAAHRWHQLVRILGLSKPLGWTPVVTTFVVDPERLESVLQFRARHAPLQKLLMRPVALVGETPLAAPYVYAVFAIALLVLAIRCRQRVRIALASSGLACELALAASSGKTDYLESTWLIAATVLAAALAITARNRPSVRHRETS